MSNEETHAEVQRIHDEEYWKSQQEEGRPAASCSPPSICEKVGEGMPCLASIWVMAGLEDPCAVCSESAPRMREMMGDDWKPVLGGRYFVGGTPEQKARLWERINEANSQARASDEG